MDAIDSKQEEGKVFEDDGAKRKSEEDRQALLVVEPAEGSSVAGLVVGQECKARKEELWKERSRPTFPCGRGGEQEPPEPEEVPKSSNCIT